jgi:pimeloyl-ACP methyl ester carboxylesterase
MKPIYYLLLFILLANGLSAQNRPYGNNPKAGKYYKLRGIQFYVEEYGTGKPLILLHGNAGSISSMSAIIPYFAKTYRTIALDSRAHGKSIDTGDSLSFEMMADDVAALLDQMNIESANLVGWSDGGIIALEMAIRHPEKVLKLASTGANLWPDSTALIPGLWEEEKKYYDAQKDKPKISDKEKNAWKLFMLDWEQPNISLSEIQNIKTPSLIICGDHDLIRIEHTVKIFQNIPKSELWILPNSSHGTLIEYPNDFYETLNRFFQTK